MSTIVLVIDSLVGAGAQRQLTNLAVGLSDKGHSVTLFFYHPKYDFLDKVRGSDVEIIECLKRGRFDLRPVWRLFTVIKEKRPDVVISYLRTPSIYCELIRMLNPSFKLIVSERISVKDGQLTYGDIAAGLLHIIASNVNSNSHDYMQHLTARLPFLKRKSSVIYNGIESVYFSSSARGVEVIPRGERIRFAVVAARCTAVKGAMVLAKALKLLTDEGITNLSISWIGPVDFESVYVRRVVQYLNEHKLDDYWLWAGKSDNVANALLQHDVLISASFQEGISNVICEAMALGLPVVVSEVSDNARIMNDGEFGSLFKPGRAADLAGVITAYCSMSSNELDEKSQMAQNRALGLFAMDRMIDEWENLCDRVLGNNTP